jgi:hypothetical protein
MLRGCEWSASLRPASAGLGQGVYPADRSGLGRAVSRGAAQFPTQRRPHCVNVCVLPITQGEAWRPPPLDLGIPRASETEMLRAPHMVCVSGGIAYVESVVDRMMAGCDG